MSTTSSQCPWTASLGEIEWDKRNANVSKIFSPLLLCQKYLQNIRLVKYQCPWTASARRKSYAARISEKTLFTFLLIEHFCKNFWKKHFSGSATLATGGFANIFDIVEGGLHSTWYFSLQYPLQLLPTTFVPAEMTGKMFQKMSTNLSPESNSQIMKTMCQSCAISTKLAELTRSSEARSLRQCRH